MKHCFVLLLFFLAVCFVQAQDISVVKFQKLENDLDARVNDPVLDQNGKKCALLKVVTIEKGFTFDVGQLGVVKTVYKPAEVWVYVPKGVNKIKITHPKLGQIKSDDGYYWFPEGGVEEATCYRMEITTAKVITTIEEAEIRSGYLIFTSEPTDASVYITVKGEERYYGKTPMTGELFPYGAYRYRLSKNMYHQESGEVRVENGRVEKHIALRPAFGYLDIRTQPTGVQVSIEGQDKEYTSPCKLPLLSGSYKVRLSKKLYGTSEQKVLVKDNETTSLPITLDPKFARLVVNSLPESSIYIDEKLMGKGPKYEVDLLEGWHKIEVRLASHKTVKKQIEIIAKKPQAISLSPTPIVGSLNIKSESTNDATIFIDDKNYGKAPQVIYEVLVGKHTIKLEKTGYESIVKEVVIEEGKMFSFEEEMETMHISLSVSPSFLSFPATGGKKMLKVLSHDDWKIEDVSETSRSWLVIKKGNGYVQVEAKENKTHSVRGESVLISTPTKKSWVYIVQQGVDRKSKPEDRESKPKERKSKPKYRPNRDVNVSDVLSIVNYPSVRTTTAKKTRIKRVTLGRDYTSVEITYNNRAESGYYPWCNIDRNTSILVNGNRYVMTKAEGIKIAPNKTYFSYAGQELTFVLYFPPIPSSAKSIDLIEPEGSPWKFYGIKIR